MNMGNARFIVLKLQFIVNVVRETLQVLHLHG